MGSGLPALAVAGTIAIIGCEPSAMAPSGSGGLSLNVQVLAPATQVSPTDGMLRIRGPATLDLPIDPGEEKTVEVPAGTYTIALEGLNSGEVALFGQQGNVVVEPEAETAVSLALESFIPEAPTAPVGVLVGSDLSLGWPPVVGASGYELEVTQNPGGGWAPFASTNFSSRMVSGLTEGSYYFRVRARNVYGSRSLPGPPTDRIEVSSAAPVLAPDEHCSENPPFAIASFADANLEAAVRSALSLEGGEPLTCEQLSRLISLVTPQAGVANLAGIQNLTELTNLGLYGNPIGDPTPLAGMTNLRFLDLRRSAISDLTPLAGLTGLTVLQVGNDVVTGQPFPTSLNSYSDITPLGGLTNLDVLSLGGPGISLNDITALSGLTNLATLFLAGTTLGDITALAALTNLTVLNLLDASIDDITPLANLTNLISLILGYNSIADITPLAGLTGLVGLGLEENAIGDISPLAGLTSLQVLYLNANEIADIAAVTGLTGLEVLYLNRNAIDDIAPLQGLTNLEKLFLEENPFSDVSALLNNPGIGSGDLVGLGPGVSCVDVTTLRARGVEVQSVCP